MTHDFDDCTAVLKHLYEFHDKELTESEADAIRQHLLACEPCLDHYQVEDALRLLIRTCCREEKAPESLRLRVRATWSRTVVVTETTD
ncbi:mycothiol system anti-sigma-R factor [Propionicimonas sp.]|uniref:mycothiol system anti-sigma-R factor n=1 Tax=Propionicimonas sp. TaxID=1955623 RepID=UPI0039E6366C